MNWTWAADGRKRAAIAFALALLAHAAAGGVVAKSPVPVHAPAPERERTEVQTFQADIRLKKPPEPKPEPPKPTPPEAKPEPPPEPPPVAPAAIPKAETAKAEAAPRRAKPKAAAKSTSKPPVGPRTVRLENLGGTSGVRAYQGSSDSFGSPEEKATPENDTPDTRPSGDGPEGSQGTAATSAEAAAPSPVGSKTVAPRVKIRVLGDYPANAPRTGRSVSLTLKLDIDDTGRVSRARVLSKPPIAGAFFDAEAVRVAMATRFEPARRDGTPIPFSIRYVVKFDP